MPLNVSNLEWLRQVDFSNQEAMRQFGPKLYQALRSIQTAHNNVEMQTNSDSSADPTPPPAINGLTVSGQNGHFSYEIQDSNQIYRGASYFIEHADNPNFTNPTTVHVGPSRNGSIFLGNVKRYWRAYSSYGTSPASPPIYHGGSQPVPVSGGGLVGGPGSTVNQGSGTGPAGVGLVGFGPVQFRSSTGVPPARKVEK